MKKKSIKPYRISYYVDAIILSNQIDVKLLGLEFQFCFYSTFIDLNNKILEKEGFELYDLFYIDNDVNELFMWQKLKLFSFKEKLIENLSFENYLNKKIVKFTRSNKLITYKN